MSCNYLSELWRRWGQLINGECTTSRVRCHGGYLLRSDVCVLLLHCSWNILIGCLPMMSVGPIRLWVREEGAKPHIFTHTYTQYTHSLIYTHTHAIHHTHTHTHTQVNPVLISTNNLSSLPPSPSAHTPWKANYLAIITLPGTVPVSPHTRR